MIRGPFIIHYFPFFMSHQHIISRIKVGKLAITQIRIVNLVGDYNEPLNIIGLTKEVTVKTNQLVCRLPLKLVINKNDVTNEIGIASELSKFFTNIVQKNTNFIENVLNLFK